MERGEIINISLKRVAGLKFSVLLIEYKGIFYFLEVSFFWREFRDMEYYKHFSEKSDILMERVIPSFYHSL